MPKNQDGANPSVRWDDSNIRNTYANICNVVSTREEVSMMLGMHQRVDTENNEVIIELSDRIVLNPYAAKRLAMAMSDVIEQYEARFGEIKLDSGAPEPAPAPAKGK